MSRPRFAPARLAAAAAVSAAVIAPALDAPSARAASAQPVLGLADANTVIMGAATAAAPGETWAYRTMPLDLPLVADPAGSLAFGRFASAQTAPPQLVFERTDDSAGGVWSGAETPLDANGDPYRGPAPNAATARITAHGGGALVGRDQTLPLGQQATVLVQDPGGRFRALPRPGDDVVQPADDVTNQPAESIADDQGDGFVPIAAFDDGARTHVFLPVVGRDADGAVADWDGQQWRREPIDLPGDTGDTAGPSDPSDGSGPSEPASTVASFRVVAIDAVSGTDAYLLGETGANDDSATGRDGEGVLLFRRVVDSSGAHWAQQPLSSDLFAGGADPDAGVDALGPLDASGQQALTATDHGVWVDGTMALEGNRQDDFTFFWSPTAGRDGNGGVAASWCDATGRDGGALCGHPLGFRFGRRAGYRSFAFNGDGAVGTRVITNPLDPGGDDTTNLGTWERFDGTSFTREAGAGGNFTGDGGFSSPDDGWIGGPVQVSDTQTPAKLAAWPVALRSPLLAVATQPGGTPGSLSSGALAVGADGAVARYTPGRGWEREFLLTSTGAVSSPLLRGVAWPSPSRAYAVGDLGAMWMYRAETGLWEKDAAAPIAFDGNLMGVAFSASDAQRGYAVGRAGVLLAYGKTWTQQQLPAGFEHADFTSIAFAGSQALVAAGSDVLENDGDGNGWHVDAGLHALLAQAPSAPRIVTVAGLPDGGAIAAGRGVVFERDSVGGPWRPAAAPLPNASVIAAAAVRVSGQVRAVVSVAPGVDWPVAPILPPSDPEVPDPIEPPFPLAGDGYVLRESDSGWIDEQRADYAGVTDDKPVKADPVEAFALDPSTGAGWAVGGWSGQPDNAGRGTSASGAGSTVRERVQTGTVERYAPDGRPDLPPGEGRSTIPLDPSQVSFAVAGHAACEGPCSLLSSERLGPDQAVSALDQALGALTGQPGAPRALLYTGGRLPVDSPLPTPSADEQRLASLLQGAPMPVYAAVSAADSLGGDATSFRSAFAGMTAPFGTAPLPAGVSPVGSGAMSAGTRTHYAFDTAGSGGTVRVIVIDNSRGSLAASDPYQVPLEPQEPWLRATLEDARARGIPAIVVGSRDLNTRFVPSSNVASDGDEIASLLVAEGASAYLYERPEEQRQAMIPAGASATIPEYGTGTLGYRSPIQNVTDANATDALFGDSGYLLVSVDASRRDPSSNRAPVTARLIPLINQLSLSAVDGTLLRRSAPALFQGLGRRPLGGDRWGPISPGDGSPNPTGADPYTSFPPALCQQANCGSRITPTYTFTSSDPDIADFVAVDPNTTNLRKPLQDARGRVVTDSTSGLLCAFNPGTTTLTVSAGGLSYSQQVTVQAGSVQQPCGTRPLDPSRFRQVQDDSPAAATPPPPAPAPNVAPSPTPAPPPPPPPPAASPPAPVVHRAPPPHHAAPVIPPPFVPAPLQPGQLPLKAPDARPIVGAPPPPATSFTSPTPPGGATVRVFEEKREEEVAPEQSSAFARYDPDEHSPLAPALIGVALLAAFAGTMLTLGVRRRDRNGPRAVAPATANARARARREQPIRPPRRFR